MLLPILFPDTISRTIWFDYRGNAKEIELVVNLEKSTTEEPSIFMALNLKYMLFCKGMKLIWKVGTERRLIGETGLMSNLASCELGNPETIIGSW